MKKLLLLIVCTAYFFSSQAQTAGDIIAKHIDAIGGKDKLMQITSMYMESALSVAGMTGVTKTSILNGKGYKAVSDINGQTVIQCITDTSGWEINPFMGSGSATSMSKEQVNASHDELYVVDPLVNYAANGAKVELKGQEKVGDVNAYKLTYTSNNNTSIDFFIDPSTWFIIKSVLSANVMGQAITANTTYADYKKTDYGIFLPYTINTDMSQYSLAFTLTTVEVNKTIDPAIFQMPK